MEKVGDSHSSSDPVSPTSNEMMKAKSPEILRLEKIKGVIEKLQTSGEDIDVEYRNGTVIVEGHFDLEKLQNEAGDAINSIRYPSRIPTSGRVPMMPVPEFPYRYIQILYSENENPEKKDYKEKKEKSKCCVL
ncbi:uncharacterized protein LOC121982369 [Zingiber officinale]|uniref:uncharacterized protein LOC121982369 n=1 Tax=Zingiber officinale TaxID=94328 RepID=UPI001C4CC104|nr:uncharacterized protein LOC121982369 [Zingiber officinale]